MLRGFMTFPSTSSSGGYGRIREIFCLIGMRDEITPLKVNLFLCLPANEDEVWSNKERLVINMVHLINFTKDTILVISVLHGVFVSKLQIIYVHSVSSRN